jgi:acylphosphatase
MEPNRVVHVLIRGRVHGVGFRAWAQHNAELRGIEGWVRNRRDGSVEAVFAGNADSLGAMLKACRQGPSGAQVEDVETREATLSSIPRPGSGRFEVLGTV